MYPDHLQNWLDYGYGLLNFIILVLFWLSEAGQIWGLWAISGERVEVNVEGERRHISDALRQVLPSFLLPLKFYMMVYIYNKLQIDNKFGELDI